MKGFEFLYLFGGELDFVAFFDVGVFSYGEEPFEAEVDDGVLEVACTFAVVSFAIEADVAGAAAGDAFKGEGVVAVYIEGPLVAFGDVELGGEFKFVGEGGFVVASAERSLSFHGVLSVGDREGLGENAEEDGFLGSVLSGYGRDLRAQGAIDVLESSEFLYVEFLNHILKHSKSWASWLVSCYRTVMSLLIINPFILTRWAREGCFSWFGIHLNQFLFAIPALSAV